MFDGVLVCCFDIVYPLFQEGVMCAEESVRVVYIYVLFCHMFIIFETIIYKVFRDCNISNIKEKKKFSFY